MTSILPVDIIGKGLSNGVFIDYDISQNNSYRYNLVLGTQSTAKNSAYCNAFNGLIDGGSVSYDYINSEFTLNWIDTSIKNNLDPFSQYTYDIFIKAEPKPSLWSSNILHFIMPNTNTSYTIKNNTTKDINDQSCKEVSTSEMGDLVLKELENEKI